MKLPATAHTLEALSELFPSPFLRARAATLRAGCVAGAARGPRAASAPASMTTCARGPQDVSSRFMQTPKAAGWIGTRGAALASASGRVAASKGGLRATYRPSVAALPKALHDGPWGARDARRKAQLP